MYNYPVLNLNSSDVLNLYFDDMDADVKNYYMTFQLCNADWSPTLLHAYDYIRGFQTARITTYRNSSISLSRYTNYQAQIPDRNCAPTRSGNYLLKVFLDGDTSRLVFTKRFLVVDNKAAIGAQVQQPFNASIFNTHQKLFITVNVAGKLNIYNQQDIKLVVMQNYAWSTARFISRPNIYRGNYFEYTDESLTAFPAGKEFLWIDLRSLRLKSDRMQDIDKGMRRTDVYVRPDGEGQRKPYVRYQDLNGLYTIENTDNLNPLWQSDYAYTHFTFYPPGGRAYEGKEIYLFGELTNYAEEEKAKMEFNAEKKAYEKTLFLKQGFYNYSYITRPIAPKEGQPLYENTEGDYWATENAYCIMVYYRPFGGRADELIGFTNLTSAFRGPGY